MAHFIGIAGHYQQERAIKRRENAILCMLVVICIVEAGIGYAAGHRGLWLMLLAIALTVPALWYMGRRFDKIIRQARMEETGAEGERSIVPTLKKLPDTYTVVCDLDFADSYGNIDHLVIGPTGIYSIDVKNWKGTVAADGAGELLLNLWNFRRRRFTLCGESNICVPFRPPI